MFWTADRKIERERLCFGDEDRKLLGRGRKLRMTLDFRDSNVSGLCFWVFARMLRNILYFAQAGGNQDAEGEVFLTYHSKRAVFLI